MDDYHEVINIAFLYGEFGYDLVFIQIYLSAASVDSQNSLREKISNLWPADVIISLIFSGAYALTTILSLSCDFFLGGIK